MQTSLRRQRRRRLGDRRRPRGNGANAAKAVAVAIPLFLFLVIALLGVAGASASVAAYTYLSRDLADPKQALDDLGFTQQTTVYDRSGDVQLARLGDDRREVVTFADIPPALIDATTSIEDKTFWENSGFDPAGFVAAAIDTIQGRDRGGSTITQQLVRARLLPSSAFEGSVYERKAKEIIQSIRLTEAYPGEAGKQTIIEKYLNQNFYGNRSYGVAAAARSYWHKDLKDLSLAQMALLAGIPQSPTRFDLVKNADEETYKDSKGVEQEHLVVPPTSEIVQRRNFILDLMKTRSVLTKGDYTDADYEAAKTEPVILASQIADQWRAPQFVWQVRSELGQILCGDASECQKIDTGGYKVMTTLDYRMQRIVEKWVYAAAIVPNSGRPTTILKNRQIPRSEWNWIMGLAGHNLHNAAAGVVDYRTGEVLAYMRVRVVHGEGQQEVPAPVRRAVRRLAPARVVDQAARLPDRDRRPDDDRGDHVHGRGHELREPRLAAYYPTQADGAERGPVRLRSALQFSLNIPAVKAGIINGIDHEFNKFQDYGLSFPPAPRPSCPQSIGTLGDPPDRHDQRLWRDRGRRRPDAAPHDPEGARLERQPGVAAQQRQADGRAHRVAPGLLHPHRHPGRQHDPQRQPVLGQVAHHRRRDRVQGPARRLQDRHDQRQQGRPRVRLPRAADQQEPAGPRRRRLDGQLRQHAQRRQALAGHVGAAVVGDPVRRVEGHADRGLRADPAQGHRHREGRRVHRHEARRRLTADRRRAVHPGHRAATLRQTSASPSTSTHRPASGGARVARARW